MGKKRPQALAQMISKPSLSLGPKMPTGLKQPQMTTRSNQTTFVSSVLLFLLLLHVSATSASLYDDFVRCLNTHPNSSASQIVIPQNNPSFTSTLRAYIRNARFNTTSTPKPVLILTPTTESHVQASVLCAKKLNVQLKIRSGGHDYEGRSYVSTEPTFVVLDLFNFRSIDVNAEAGYAWAQAGATLGELYYRIAEKSKTLGFPAGICPTVGVGGHVSAGGYGNLLRKYGLSVDNILDALIVDVNGKLLDRKTMGEDLFWAIRGGGGGSFGVILSYKLKLVPEVAPSTVDDLWMRMLVQPVSSPTKKGTKTVRISVLGQYLGNANQLVSVLGKEFPELGLKKEDCLEMSWIESVVWWNDGSTPNTTKPEVLLDRNLDQASFGKRKSDYVQTPISREGLESLWKKLIELGKTGLVFNAYGGKMARVSASDAPFPHRAGNLFKIQYSVSWEDGGEEATKEYLNQTRVLYSFMTPFVSKNPRSAFLAYRDLDIGVNNFGKDSYEQGKVYGLKYFNDNFNRLVKVKTAVDPENFFRNEQSIPPLPKKAC
ncbi:hypothetical protein ACLB2K_025261 [Fragaria x ananassa]